LVDGVINILYQKVKAGGILYFSIGLAPSHKLETSPPKTRAIHSFPSILAIIFNPFRRKPESSILPNYSGNSRNPGVGGDYYSTKRNDSSSGNQVF
jgi:hypothetical protein